MRYPDLPNSRSNMLIIESISAGICAWVLCRVLMEPGMIFEKWGDFVHRLNSMGFEWLAKPLGACGVCFSGQFGLWFYLIAWRDRWVFGEVVCFTMQTIFFFLILQKLETKLETWSNQKNESG